MIKNKFNNVVLHIHADDNIGSHLPGYIYRIVVNGSAVHQYHRVQTDGGEDCRDSHTRAHGRGQYPAVEDYFLAAGHIFGYTGKGDGQFVEVDGVMVADSQSAKQVCQVFAANGTAKQIFFH